MASTCDFIKLLQNRSSTPADQINIPEVYLALCCSLNFLNSVYFLPCLLTFQNQNSQVISNLYLCVCMRVCLLCLPSGMLHQS